MEDTTTRNKDSEARARLREGVMSGRDWIDRAAALAWLVEAVKTPSVTGDEMEFAALVAEELEACGADEVNVIEVEPGRPIVWSRTAGSGGPSVMLVGHLDTVGEGNWRKTWDGDPRADPFDGVIVGGALWGRGTADMKGGIASALAALRTFHEQEVRPYGDVLTLWVADEESGEPGTGRSVGIAAAAKLMDEGVIPRPSFAVYLEPTQLKVYAAQIGFAIAEIEITGKAAYFAHPEEGVDALRAGNAVYAALDGLNTDLVARGAHVAVGPPRLLVMGMRAGGPIPAVPESCVISLIRSIVPGEDVGEAAEEIRATAVAALEGNEVSMAVRFTAGRNHEAGGTPSETDPELPQVQQLFEAARAVAPDHAAISGAEYWSEGPFFTERGIPCVYFGAGNILNCHTPEEHVPLEEFDAASAALVLFLAGDGGPVSV